MIRRMVRQVGSVAVAGWLWNHRGSVVRGIDLVRRIPQLVSAGRTGDAVTEARAIAALDGRVPTSTDIRVTGIDDGAVIIRGDGRADELDAARQTLLGVRDVLEVRTDATGQPTLEDPLAPVGH